MTRTFFAIGSVSAFLAVAAGAFGAHGLKKILSAEMMAVFETGVRYQMYHALGLLAVAWAISPAQWPGRAATSAGWLFVAGAVLFFGGLYSLALSGIRR